MATSSAPPLMKLSTDLGDALRFRSLSATEEMGRLFEFSVLALANADAAVDTAQLLGKGATVTIQLGHDGPRYFHGQVVRAGLESAVGKLVSWRLQLRPWLWQLTRRSDCRIYQSKSVKDIITDVFSTYSGVVVDWQLQGTPPPRPYCVQYRETDFNFVSRLLEEEGMYYFHRHTDGEHTLVICNSMTKHADFAGFGKIKFRESQDQLTDLEAITEWRHVHELTSGKVTLTDYDFLKPGTDLKVEKSSTVPTAKAAFERYDHPGLYTEIQRGTDLALVRQQELDARVLRVTGFSTTVGALSVGYTFELEDHPLASENKKHLVLSTRIEALYAGYESGQGQNEFTCRIGAMRYADVFRPDRITPKPLIAGPQTAVVVGPSGEEIHTDEHGRAKVKFYWDRLNGATDHDKTSCWVRVSSQWAGKAWGQISLPRIGQEVVVDFLEGDPDRPLITGRVYNAVQVPPYKLPDHKTVSTLKSQSSKGGTTANANELRFEDDKGKEYIWFQAERNMRYLVKWTSWAQIKKNSHHTVGGDFLESVGGKHHWTVKGEVSGKTEDKYTLHSLGDMWIKSANYKFETAEALWKSKYTVFDVVSLNLNASGTAKMTSADKLSLKGKQVMIEADSQISLKVGGNFIDIGPTGVSIRGTMVLINSGGAAGSADAASTASSGTPPDPDKPSPPKDPLTPAA